MLTGVPRHHIDTVWPLCLPLLRFLDEAPDGREHSSDLYHWLGKGKLQLWVWLEASDIVSGLLITEIIDQARGRVCRLRVCLGRDPQRWLPELATIEAWAKEQGCRLMEPIARPGWGKLLAPFGYRITHAVLEKAL